MNLLFDILRSAMGAAMTPLAALPPAVSLTLWSLVLGALAALAFKYTSSQRGLRRVADASRASLLRLRLYGGDDVVTFRAIAGLLSASFQRLFFSLSPLIVLAPPFALILGQMAMYYQFRPLPAERPAVVTMRLSPDGWNQRAGLTLAAPADAAPGRHDDPATREIVWRFAPAPAVDRLEWRFADGTAVAKELRVAAPGAASDGPLTRVSPVRAGPPFASWSNFGDAILFPGERLFDAASPVERIEINYPDRSTPILGVDVHWVITFFVLSIVGALLAKPFVKVQF